MPYTNTARITFFSELNVRPAPVIGTYPNLGCPGIDGFIKSQSTSHNTDPATLTFGCIDDNPSLFLIRIEHVYLPPLSWKPRYLNFGARFSLNAAIPSAMSSEIMVMTWALASNSTAEAKSMVSPW